MAFICVKVAYGLEFGPIRTGPFQPGWRSTSLAHPTPDRLDGLVQNLFLSYEDVVKEESVPAELKEWLSWTPWYALFTRQSWEEALAQPEEKSCCRGERGSEGPTGVRLGFYTYPVRKIRPDGLLRGFVYEGRRTNDIVEYCYEPGSFEDWMYGAIAKLAVRASGEQISGRAQELTLGPRWVLPDAERWPIDHAERASLRIGGRRAVELIELFEFFSTFAWPHELVFEFYRELGLTADYDFRRPWQPLLRHAKIWLDSYRAFPR